MNKRLMNAKDAELIVKTSVLKRRRKDKKGRFHYRHGQKFIRNKTRNCTNTQKNKGISVKR